MAGNATPIIDVSKIIKNCASERIDNAFHRLECGTVVVNDAAADFVSVRVGSPFCYLIWQ